MWTVDLPVRINMDEDHCDSGRWSSRHHGGVGLPVKTDMDEDHSNCGGRTDIMVAWAFL